MGPGLVAVVPETGRASDARRRGTQAHRKRSAGARTRRQLARTPSASSGVGVCGGQVPYGFHLVVLLVLVSIVHGGHIRLRPEKHRLAPHHRLPARRRGLCWRRMAELESAEEGLVAQRGAQDRDARVRAPDPSRRDGASCG